MTTRQFSDGLVELVMSGKSCPPGYTGQAGNCSSVWFRVDGGAWEPGSTRAMHKHLEALELAGSVAEFRRLLETL